jgi:hypothetical protein
MKISFSRQPEIVLSNQKDEFYRVYFGNRLEDAVKSVLSVRQVLRFEKEWRLLTDLLYYGLSILPGTCFSRSFDVSPLSRSNKFPYRKPNTRRRVFGNLTS